MRRLLVAAVVLAAIYLLVVGSVAPGDLAVGGALGLVVAWGLRGVAPAPRTQRPSLRRWVLGIGPLALGVAREVVEGTWQVAQVSLGLRDPSTAGFVEIPLEDRTHRGAIAWALLTNVSPGEVVVDLDEERGVALVHVLDATDPDAVRRRHHERRALEREVAP